MASMPDLSHDALDVIFACSVCGDRFSTVYKDNDRTVGGLTDGINQRDRKVTRLYVATCGHVICIKHIGDGRGPAFHQAGKRPSAPCPICIRDGVSTEARDLLSVRGFEEGQYDPALPKEWMSAPHPSLYTENPESESLRFQYFALIRYAQHAKQSMRTLQADLDNARSKLILVGVHPDHEKMQRQEREIERLRAVEEEAHRLRSSLDTRLHSSLQPGIRSLKRNRGHSPAGDRSTPVPSSQDVMPPPTKPLEHAISTQSVLPSRLWRNLSSRSGSRSNQVHASGALPVNLQSISRPVTQDDSSPGHYTRDVSGLVENDDPIVQDPREEKSSRRRSVLSQVPKQIQEMLGRSRSRKNAPEETPSLKVVATGQPASRADHPNPLLSSPPEVFISEPTPADDPITATTPDLPTIISQINIPQRSFDQPRRVSSYFGPDDHVSHRMAVDTYAERQNSIFAPCEAFRSPGSHNQTQEIRKKPPSLNGLSFFSSPVNEKCEPINWKHEQNATLYTGTSDHYQVQNLSSRGFITKPNLDHPQFYNVFQPTDPYLIPGRPLQSGATQTLSTTFSSSPNQFALESSQLIGLGRFGVRSSHRLPAQRPANIHAPKKFHTVRR